MRASSVLFYLCKKMDNIEKSCDFAEKRVDNIYIYIYIYIMDFAEAPGLPHIQKRKEEN